VATWRLALALTLPALLLNPVLITIGFGQVNLFVTFLVMWDLLSERRIGKRQLPLGIATGVAAAVKLTPLLFLPYLVLTRRWRAALTGVVTFGACELLTYAVSPASSKAYWTQAVFKPGRAGDLSIVDNQNLWGVLDRFTHGLLPDAVMLPLLLLAAASGLWLAAQAHRRSSPFLGVLVCAVTCLIVSPISWVHHMVWVVPAIIWLALAPDRPRWGRPLAAATAVLFWSAPVWWVPYKNTSDLHLNPLQLIAGNSFFLAMLVFLAGAAVLVVRRGTLSSDETIRLTRLPT
jgi:alpha-1,2-mannosyltransferase